MNNQIFCPCNHLILDQPSCPICGWQRPPDVNQGSLLWEPVSFPVGIGGPAQESFTRPGVVNGIAVFPLRSGELVGINQKDGRILWRSEPTPDLYPRHLHVDGSNLLAVIADNRSLEKAGNGFIAHIDPQTGRTEKIWEGYGFTMTEPVFTDSLVIVRTAHPKLVALNRNGGFKVLWEVPLKTYKPISPVIAGDLVLAWDGEVTKEQMILKAFALKNGSFVWQTNISDIDCSPVVTGSQLIYRTGKHIITSIDLKDGKQLWQKSYSRIYSIPSVAGNKLYLMMCDSADVNSTAHYSLQCVDPETGTPEWQAPLGIRAQEILFQPDGTLLVGMGDPNIAICSPQDGSILWQYCFGEEKVNRVQTHLVVQDGICWAGTYEGKIAAIQISEDSKEVDDPEKCLAEGNFEGAAAAFALKGELKKSADIYLDKLNQPQKASAIYEKINDISGQVAVLLKQGNELTAARLLEKDGQLAEAAKLFEEANELRTAMQIYQTLGLHEEVSRLRKLVPLKLDDIEALEKEGNLVEAGDAAMRLREFRKAFDLYEQTGDEQKENALDAITQLCELNPEPWTWEKMADLARKLGHFQAQAKALEKVGSYYEAAEAYYYAGLQLEQRSPTEKENIAGLYDAARKLFEQEGMDEKQHQCWEKTIYYRKTPWIQVYGRTDKAFREGEFNTLLLTVKNIGYGRADEIDVQIKSNRFEVDKFSMPDKIKHLGANEEKVITLPVRPLKEQVGENVPFILEWYWKDKANSIYQDKSTVTVAVKQQSDSRTSGTPVIINAEKYYAGGDNHQEITGDVIGDGGQKGDRIEINREGHIKVIDKEIGEISPSALVKRCPNCSLPVDTEAKFCDACGYELKD